MATSSYAKSLIGTLATDIKKAVGLAFEYMLEGNLAFGPITHQDRTTNFKGVYLVGTTSSVAGQEFSIAHGMGRVPNVYWHVGDPLTVNSQTGIPLTVSRAADTMRLYFSSSSTGVVFVLYAE